MTEHPRSIVAADLAAEEGFRGEQYSDSRGHPTIGYGIKLPLTKAEGLMLLHARLSEAQERLNRAAPWVRTLPVNQQAALLDMAYQLGVDGVLEFTDMLEALRKGECGAAEKAGLDSEWARETPDRAKRVTDRFCN